jgi:histidinol-phosphate aminotransferase
MIAKLHGYTPGEQPKIKGLTKLNTNENPYGPSPKVLAAIKAATDGRLRLYPSPAADRLRERLATFHQCQPRNILVGNGSDELLALATRAFVEPLTGLTGYALGMACDGAASKRRRPSAALSGEHPLDPAKYTVQFFHPSYSLYPVLAEIHGARAKSVALHPDFTLPDLEELRGRGWDWEAALTYITTPNAPSGRAYSRSELEAICEQQRGVVILDEAYVDFAEGNALELALRYPHVLVSRTFSKAYSLCSLRVGYLVGDPDLIAALHKVRDSYNVNGLGQVAAEATLDSLPYYRKNFRRIIQSRQFLSERLTGLGFEVLPSQTNFLLVRPPGAPAERWLRRLRQRKVLVRWFSTPELRAFLRITIGSAAEVEVLLRAVRSLL